MTLQEIAGHLKGQLSGPPELEISGLAKIDEAQAGQITFLSNKKYIKYLATTRASAILVDHSIGDVPLPCIKVDNAYSGFVMLLHLFDPGRSQLFQGISSQAFIHPSAKVEDNVHIGPFVFVGPQVQIARNTTIYPGVVLLDHVRIGEGCIIYPNVSIRENCVIGNRVILHNGVVIGSDGFGFAPKQNEYVKIPQIGGVIIEDDVEIGANTAIDRATLGNTIIKRGSKLDNLIQIAHNVVIGENTVMAAQSGIAGSTEVGNHVTIAGQVGITGHIQIGDEVIIGAQSGISNDVPTKTVMFGTPAVPLMQRKRIDVSLRHLPEAMKKIQALEKEIRHLKEELQKIKKSE